jgi:SpoVK/Ycf46/Vps4 family AAA+-type ATPase
MIRYGLCGDGVGFRKAAEAICADERAKRHDLLADRIEGMLRAPNRTPAKELPGALVRKGSGESNAVFEKLPEKRIESLLLSQNVADSCLELVEEHMRADLLRSHGMEPRNRILLIGPPGNGKTSLAEALAEKLTLPFLTVKYESLIGSYLGETASRLGKLFDYVKTRQCVLFFDEFETLGKERGDIHETGEIKRVVSSLLLQIDALPSYVIAIAATNHESLLDRAAWRRFQVRLTLKAPSQGDLEEWFKRFEKQAGFDFGLEPSVLARKLVGRSFAEAEEFAQSVYRRYILDSPGANAKSISERLLKLYAEAPDGDKIAAPTL